MSGQGLAGDAPLGDAPVVVPFKVPDADLDYGVPRHDVSDDAPVVSAIDLAHDSWANENGPKAILVAEGELSNDQMERVNPPP